MDPTGTDEVTPSRLGDIPNDIVTNTPTINSAFYTRESPTERSLFIMFSDGSTTAVYSYDLKST